ncbi:MAG: N-acetylglucosamine-6-phosphate deacetylase [Planctomycetaceae bacterium]|nr:N-acetylglucosamine-6-phosphate deacetylase [Planctomycetaceae bacterium]
MTSNTPQFVDLQVNGYAGVDFNQDNLSAADLRRACERLRGDGVAGIQATIITDELPRMEARIKRIATIHGSDSLVRDVVWGIHVEGPFISDTPGCYGAHPRAAVRPADVDAMQRLLDAGDGLVRMVTLAPERDTGMKLVRHLAAQNILVSAGHCDPTLDQLREAIDAGLTMFTHLGNGCPTTLPRHDNIIQRALSLREKLTICFIADGIHIPAVALGNYLRLTGTDRAIAVTDAMAAAGCGPGHYRIGSQNIDVCDDMVAWAPDGSHLAGSTATMPTMASVLREQTGFSDADIRRLTLDNPRRVLGRG